MLVKNVIAQLQSKWYKPDDHIMIGWCEFGDVELDDAELTKEIWQEACTRADDNEYLFDMETARIITISAEYDIKHGAL